MSTENQNWRWTYEPNGITTRFAVDNLVLSEDELIVKWWSAAGVELALPSWSFDGIGEAAGGDVVFDSAPATTAGSVVEIIRKTTPLQETEFEDFIQESAAARQERSDRQFLLAQELRGLLDRALLFSPLDPAGPFRIPAPSVRANKALMFGAGPLAQLTVGSPMSPGDLTVSAFVETLLDDNDADAFLGTLSFSAFVKSLKSMVDGPAFRAAIGAVGGGSSAAFPQGRLTLASGVRVMGSTAYTAKTVLYFTAGIVPIWNGTEFVPTICGELQNDLTQSATGKAGPAAAGPHQVLDGFVWNDAGTIRLTRGPKWIKTGPASVTIATPAVVTMTGADLKDGQTFRWPSTTGVLPTGAALNTDYFVTRVTADTFKLSSSLANMLAGTFINTSGAQAGTHTGENYTTDRGASVGTTELEWLNGIPVNKYDIVNGPAARKGTYVGSVKTDGSSQMNWQPGGIAAGGLPALLHVWNMHNRRQHGGLVGESTDNWTYTTATWRVARLQEGMRVSALQGVQEEPVWASYRPLVGNGGGGNNIGAGVGFNSTIGPTGRYSRNTETTANYFIWVEADAEASFLGVAEFWPLEWSQAASTTTWYGDAGGTLDQSGFRYRGSF